MAKFKIKKVVKDQKRFSLIGTALATGAVTGVGMGIGKAVKDTKNIIEGNTEELK